MKFSFKNIGQILEAEIELPGLTVLAGLNDTGKSFITKSIFGVIKTIGESSAQSKIEQFELIQVTLNQIYQTVRPIIQLGAPASLAKILPQNVTNQVAAIFSASNSSFDNSYVLQLLTGYFAEIETAFSSVTPVVAVSRNIPAARKMIDPLIQSLLSKISSESNEEDNCKRFFDRGIVKKFFQGQISKIGSHESSIKILENDAEIVNINISNNNIQSFEIKDILFFKDATLIESPIILQLAKFINSTLLLQGSPINRRMAQQRAELPYHIYDLIEKLYLNQPFQNEKFVELNNSISNIIGGKLILEPSELNFTFLKNNNQKIKSFNIASGVKAFGIIQLLLNSGAINNNSFLIIDEPEVHTHPKWAIEYARIIVALSEAGIPILISSHSPYLIEAIYKYSESSSIKDKTKFYFGKNIDENSTIFDDVTQDLTPIFAALSEPFKQLYSINV